MPADTAVIYENRVARALEEVERQGRANFQRLVGAPDMETARALKKHVAQLGDPIRPKRQSGTWLPGMPPTGAEWFFARWCALQCVHLWDAPKVVRDYLDGGDPQLAAATPAELRRADFWGTEVRRETAAGAASLYCMFNVHRSRTFAGICAAWSALYSASGNIHGAAEWSISALVNDALEKVRAAAREELSQDDCLAVTSAARAKLQSVFADTAREIYEGENHA